jgi:glycosyltransferase involved in cell wall biosynthesis
LYNITPRVSVIIPVYNGDRYIAQAIDSILDQTYKDFEIIVVNDGSTDNTAQILQTYLKQDLEQVHSIDVADSRDEFEHRDPVPMVKFIPASENAYSVEQKNQGVAVARNRGIQAARGEFIAFLDQDDWFLPDKLAAQIATLEEKSSLSIVSSGWQIVDEHGRKLSAIQPWHGIPALNLEDWIIWKPVFLGAMVFRRAVLETVAGFNSEFQQTSDVDLVLRLAAMGCEACWVKQETVCYRQHQNNASRNVLQQVRELEVVLDQFFGRSDLPESVRRLENQSRYQSLVWSAWRLYYSGHIAEMAIYLKKSLYCRGGTWTEAVLNWIEVFKQYTTEYGNQLDVPNLTQLQEWKWLVQECRKIGLL